MAQTSYGYGRWDAKCWFIGPELGMSKDEDELASRVAAWRSRGSRDLDDCHEYHRHIQEFRWHGHNGKRPVLQRTWAKLLITLMAYEGLPSDLESRKTYQASKWGSLLGDVSVIELSGVPAHNEKVERDRESFLESRIEVIRKKMETHTPEFVLLYGKSASCARAWDVMTRGAEPLSIQDGTIAKISKYGKSFVAWSPHPVSYGLKSDHWETLGLTLRELNRKVHRDN